jgi:hypothetical protein
MNAYGVVIRWQSTDFSNAPATAVATTTGAAAEATHDSSGLTAGAGVGIGIGAAVAVILFVAVGVFLLRRRNRREGGLGDATQRDPYMVLPEHPSRMQVEAELPVNKSSDVVYRKAELADNLCMKWKGAQNELNWERRVPNEHMRWIAILQLRIGLNSSQV